LSGFAGNGPNWVGSNGNGGGIASSSAFGELFDALRSVTHAGSSESDLGRLVSTAVEQVKHITGADKALFCALDDEFGKCRLDLATVVARGARDEHPEEWWSQVVLELAADELAEDAEGVVVDQKSGSTVAVVTVHADEDAPSGLLAAITSRRRGFSDNEIDFMSIVGSFLGFAIENAMLMERTRYSLLATERERIAREMHDGVAQSLFGASLGLEVCRKSLRRDPSVATQRLEDAQEVLSGALAELRRHIYALRPERLGRMGLRSAIEAHIADVNDGRIADSLVVVEGRERLIPSSVEACLYRVAREAITNSARHSGCDSLEVYLSYGDASVCMHVRDNGSGFDIDEALARSERDGGIGLRSVRARVQAEGGRLEIRTARERGTELMALIPC
jgi:signal transduction histidine kinase